MACEEEVWTGQPGSKVQSSPGTGPGL